MSVIITGVKRTREEAKGRRTLKDKLFESCLSVLTPKCVQRHTGPISLERSSSYVLGFTNCEFVMKSDTPLKYEITGICSRRSTRGAPYKVSVAVKKDENEYDITSDCTCPKYYNWCKHMAALAITFIKDQDSFEFVPFQVHQQREEVKRQEEIERQRRISKYVYVVISRKDYLSDGWNDHRNPKYFESKILGIYDNEEAANDRALEEVEEMGGDPEDDSLYNSDGLVYYSEMADENIPLPHEDVVFVKMKPLMKRC